MNLLLRARRGKGQEDVAAIDAFVHCEPETPRLCQIALATLSETRAKVGKHLKNSYFRQVRAPAGVAPQLIATTELN